MSVPWLDLPSIARVPEGQLPSKAEFLQLLCHCVGGKFSGKHAYQLLTLMCKFRSFECWVLGPFIFDQVVGPSRLD